METNKLKHLLVAFCCFVAALCSEAQGIENQTDTVELITVNHKINMQSSQNLIDDLVFAPVSPRLNLDDSESSWASYMTSPVKTTFHMARTVINMVNYHDYKVVLVGVVLACQFTAAAADYCACMCFKEPMPYGSIAYAAVLPNASGCVQWCQEQFPGNTFWSCLPVSKI